MQKNYSKKIIEIIYKNRLEDFIIQFLKKK